MNEIRIQRNRGSRFKSGGSEQGIRERESKSTSESKSNKVIRYFSMFTGVGGFELGLERANDNQCTNEESRQTEPNKDVSMREREIISKVSWGTSRIWDVKKEGRSVLPSGSDGMRKFSCVGMSEWDKYSSQVLKYQFPNIKNWGDCTKIKPEDLPDFDMLCGGFPCQAFSIAGKRRGFEDTRGTMFFEVARILKVKRPKIVLLENVKGLLNHNKGETFSVILEALDELGYEVQWMVLNSKFFGVPQNRERVLIIGNLRGTSRPEILPFGEVSSKTNGEDKMIGIAQQGSQAQRVYTTDLAPTLKGLGGGQGAKTRLYAVLTPDRENKRKNGRRFKEDGEPSFTLTGQDVHGVAEIKNPLKGKTDYGWHFEQNVYSEDSNCRSLKSAEGSGNKPKVIQEMKIRRLTPTECCRLQGFPDDWNKIIMENGKEMSDTQRYKQMGNAVTTNVIKAIGERLLK